MSLLAFKPIDDARVLPLLARPRWRYALALTIGFVVMIIGTLVSEQFRLIAVKSTISEIANFAVPIGLFCWVAWFREAHAARRAAIVTLIWSLTSCAVNVLTKRDATEHFLTNGTAGSWVLLGGTLFLIAPTLILTYARNTDAMYSHGIRWTNLRWQLSLGFIVGCVIALHFISTVRFSGVLKLSIKPLPYIIWTLGYESMQSFAEEAFFRGLLFRSLQNVFKLNAWQATGITLILNIAPYLLKTEWRNPLELIGLVIYLMMISAAGCILFRRYQSILPGYVVNIVFSSSSLLR